MFNREKELKKPKSSSIGVGRFTYIQYDSALPADIAFPEYFSVREPRGYRWLATICSTFLFALGLGFITVVTAAAALEGKTSESLLYVLGTVAKEVVETSGKTPKDLAYLFAGIILIPCCVMWSIGVWQKRLEVGGEELKYFDSLGRIHTFSSADIFSVDCRRYSLYDHNGKKLSGSFDLKPDGAQLLMRYLSERHILAKEIYM